MAKFENELDTKAARTAAARKKNEVMVAIGADKKLSAAIDSLVKNTKVRCLIFSGKVSFREGAKSTVQLPGYGKFKADLKKPAKDTFTSSLKFDKSDPVLIACCYFLINHPERVSAESDKTEAAESAQFDATKAELKKMVDEFGTIRLKVGDEFYQVDDFAQQPKRLKADMVFTHNGKPVIYVSHKKGNAPGAFQQYGGFARDLGISTYEDTAKYPAIRKFIDDITSIFEAFNLKKDAAGRFDFNNLVKGSNFARPLDDETLAHKVIFGKDYETGKIGDDNVSIVIDGNILFKKIPRTGPNIFELAGEYHSEVNPCLLRSKRPFRINLNDIYTPMMFIQKSEQQGLNQAGFSNVRAVIWPRNKITRGYHEDLDTALNIIRSKDKARISELRKQMVKP